MTMPTAADLADFLRSRRASLNPSDVGIASGGDRRVTGLRREEVATLAAVSADYYRRLEQGRERHPSQQVLRSLADALRLDDHDRRHLFDIGSGLAGAAGGCGWREISDGTRGLIDCAINAPASVVGPASDVLAMNSLAETLYSPFSRTDNLALMMFLDPVAPDFYQDWDAAARASVANLRAASSQFPGETRVAEVIGQLTIESSAFTRLWAEHEVKPQIESDILLCHNDIGDVLIRFAALTVSGNPAQRIYVYMQSPDAVGAQALRELDRQRRGERASSAASGPTSPR